MLTFIILIVLIAIGWFLITTWDYELLGILMCPVFGLLLIAHSLVWGLASYEHGLFVEKRNAFEQTLKVARERGNEYETAAIVKEVALWNTELAKRKFDNKTLLFGQYVDDRIESVKPIK